MCDTRYTVLPNSQNRFSESDGAGTRWSTFHNVIYLPLSSLTVLIYDQVAESHMVTTRKTITRTHRGPLFQIASTGKKIAIELIDMDFKMIVMSIIGELIRSLPCSRSSERRVVH